MAITGLPQLPDGMKWRVEFEDMIPSYMSAGVWTATGHVYATRDDGITLARGTFLASSWEEPAAIEQKIWRVAKAIITNELDASVKARENFGVLLEDLSGYYPPNTLIKAL